MVKDIQIKMKNVQRIKKMLLEDTVTCLWKHSANREVEGSEHGYMKKNDSLYNCYTCSGKPPNTCPNYIMREDNNYNNIRSVD